MNTPRKLHVLVVDDDPRVLDAVRLLLEDAGHTVTVAADGDRALEALAPGRFDAAVLDVNMPRMNGLVTMMRMAEIDPALSMIILTGESAIQTAREAILRVGAFDLIAKPPDGEHLIGVLEEAARITGLRRSGTRPAGPARDEPHLGMVGESPALRGLAEQIHQVAPSQGRVLITGENGAGKDLVAHALHRLSKRAAGPFVKINCAAIPKDLVESELFGYERGAFTGAMQAK